MTPKRLRYHGDQFFLKTPAEMAAVFGDFPEALRNTVAIAERCNVVLPSGENHLPNFDVPAPFTVDDYFEHMVREGFAVRLPRLREIGRRRLTPPFNRGIFRPSRLRDRDDQEDEVPGLLPHRLGLHPIRART